MTSRSVLARLLVVTALGAGVTFVPRDARAQTDKELQEARELFQEAYKDEQEKRYDVALEKFRKVAAVKESAQVRYRIASVLDAMNKLREARDAYRACAAMKPNLLPKDQPVADACAEKALAVDKRVPKLVVTVSGESPPPDTRVTVDGAPVPTGKPIEQDPGEHTIQATATGMKPFEQRVTLPDNGSQIPATVTFESATTVEHPPDTTPKKDNTVAFIALGAGGVLLTTGIVMLFVREGAISDIKDACPVVSACPRSKQSDVEGNEDTANLLLPLGIGFSVVGAALAGYGVYRLVKKPSGEAAPAQEPAKAGKIDFAPRYLRGGAFVGVSGTF